MESFAHHWDATSVVPWTVFLNGVSILVWYIVLPLCGFKYYLKYTFKAVHVVVISVPCTPLVHLRAALWLPYLSYIQYQSCTAYLGCAGVQNRKNMDEIERVLKMVLWTLERQTKHRTKVVVAFKQQHYGKSKFQCGNGDQHYIVGINVGLHTCGTIAMAITPTATLLCPPFIHTLPTMYGILQVCQVQKCKYVSSLERVLKVVLWYVQGRNRVLH